MSALNYINQFAEKMGLQVVDEGWLRQMVVVKRGDREVLGFSYREIVNADNSGHPRNWIEPQFKALACKIKEGLIV